MKVRKTVFAGCQAEISIIFSSFSVHTAGTIKKYATLHNVTFRLHTHKCLLCWFFGFRNQSDCSFTARNLFTCDDEAMFVR